MEDRAAVEAARWDPASCCAAVRRSYERVRAAAERWAAGRVARRAVVLRRFVYQVVRSADKEVAAQTTRRQLPWVHVILGDAAVVRLADAVRAQRVLARPESLAAAARVARNSAASARVVRKALDRGAAVRLEPSESVAERVEQDAAEQRGVRQLLVARVLLLLAGQLAAR